MDIFELVVAVVAISCTAGVVNTWLKNQRLARNSAPDQDVQAELENLKSRVAVLEEIVTDDRYRLKRELDGLERGA